MTDYNNKEKFKKNKRREKFFEESKVHRVNEKSGLASKYLESDSLVQAYDKYSKTYRPAINSKDPSQFASFGSAEFYYEEAASNIINYYPFDGTREEIINWHRSGSDLDVSLYRQFWPSAVGHFKTNYEQYVDFYAGPNKINEAEFVGKVYNNETGLHINPASGSTVEFWMKKEGFNHAEHPEETIFDIGSYPGKLSASDSAQIRLDLSASSGSPFRLTYYVGGEGAQQLQLGSTNVTTASVADSAWHHYALKAWHSGSNLYVKFYIDGQVDSTKIVSAGTMPIVNNYLGGTLAAPHGATTSSFSGSLDNFRYWKGLRSSRNITRFYDKKVFASDQALPKYDDRLGLNFRFNKAPVGNSLVDAIVVDYSGNDIVGKIKEYSSACRALTSAITEATQSANVENGDAILDHAHPDVSTLVTELKDIAKTHDLANSGMLENFIPQWARGEIESLGNESEFRTLLNLMSSEFDRIKVFLESLRKDNVPNHNDTNYDIEADTLNSTSSVVYSSNIFIGCKDETAEAGATSGNRSSRPLDYAQNYGLEHEAYYQKASNTADYVENIVENLKSEEAIFEVRQAIANRCAVEAENLMKRKGTRSSIDSIYSISGIDNTEITDMILAPGAELFIQEEKDEAHTARIKSVNFYDNRSAVLYMSSSLSDELTYIPSGSGVERGEYSFEGSFIFPSQEALSFENIRSSVFGIRAVSASTNDLTVNDPDPAELTVYADKVSIDSEKARFVLQAGPIISQNLSSSIINKVYDNSRWNISVRVRKSTSEPFIKTENDKYELVFAGYNYILNNLVNSFSVTSSITQQNYQNFNESNKTIFIGAENLNITGTNQQESDCKVVNFSAWNQVLSNQELTQRAKSPLHYGVSRPYEENSAGDVGHQHSKALFRVQFSALEQESAESSFVVEDETSGSSDLSLRHGRKIGNKYNFKSQGFSTNTSKVIQDEYIPIVRPTPLSSLKGLDEVTLNQKSFEKFNLSSRPELKMFSFEKSVNQAISRDMYDFLCGVSAYNNIIGEYVNKYRKNYKALEHLRENYFTNVLSDPDFERYLSYYRWIDSAIGVMFEQMIPGSSIANVGIENVVESHALERNKYQHKYNRVERKDPDIETNLLAINELMYDWEHGHAPIPESDDDHCLWQSERKEPSSERESIQKALTTKVSGSTYVLRNLVKPYRYSVDRQSLLNVGHNRNANKIKDLYKIVNEGKEITINSDDIYEFRKCNDVLDPNEEKLYTAKTNTSDTSGYLDADADLILPFSLYSASVGTDFSVFKQEMKITNNLELPSAIQTTLPRHLIQGMSHRNVEIGLTSSAERPEAYTISASSDSFVVKESPNRKSVFHKGPAGMRPYVIGNVKTSTDPVVIGNYSKDYEIVMTNSRHKNNNYLVENEGLNLTGGLNVSAYISGSTDFKVPERTKREHVIVNRFSAPGSPESMGNFGRDRVSEEYSIYNTVNYRNSLVRDVLNTLSTERSERFGYRSGSTSQASIHKTNRNLFRFTGSLGEDHIADNLFVQRPIPQNDYGYSWIIASATGSVYDFLNRNQNIGYTNTYSLSGTLKPSQVVTFLSSSEQVSNLDFVNLNTFTTRSLSLGTNIISHTLGDLNSIILNRQGPYGWPTWKQIRGEYNPLRTAQVKNNTMSVVFRGRSPFAHSYAGSKFDYSRTKEDHNKKRVLRTTRNYKEIMATCKFNPITVSMHTYATENGIEFLADIPLPAGFSQTKLAQMWFTDEYFHEYIIKLQEKTGVVLLPSLSMRAPVQNTVTGFANQEMADDMYFKERPFLRSENLEAINDFIRENSRDRQATYLEINYIETIYPREINTFTIHARQRQNFDFFGWKSDRANRQLISTGNLNYNDLIHSDSSNSYFRRTSPIVNQKEFDTSYYNSYEIVDMAQDSTSNANFYRNTHITSSKWVLDSRRNFSALPLNITSSYFNQSSSFLARGGDLLSIRGQGIRGEGILQNDYSIFPLGINILRGAPPFAPVYNRRIPQKYNNDVYLSGEAKWEATANSPTGPFYDKYETFIDEGRRVGQEYSLVPEYRMSMHVEDIFASGNFSNPTVGEDFLQLTGAVYHTSSGDISIGKQFFKTYSNSDFMKYFQPLKENMDRNSFDLSTGKLTLRCAAVKRLLPYRGFYPAERAVQLTEIFSRNYMPSGSYDMNYIENSIISKQQSEDSILLKVENAKSQVAKPLFAPGILFNSIKTGLAVDYPIFSSSVSGAANYLVNFKIADPVTSFSGFGFNTDVSYTGSLINNTVDFGVPRISGSVDRRITFEDLLQPERLFGQIIHENEPHPSASIFYGDRQFLKVIEHEPKFGTLNSELTSRYNASNFTQNWSTVESSLRPYRSAINNFCAETVRFFLEEEKLQTIVSRPSKPRLESGVNYKMRVYVQNKDTAMYDRHSAFGPPVDDGNPTITEYILSQSSTTGVAATASLGFGSISSPHPNLSGSTITIINTGSVSKTFEFITDPQTEAASATATISFDATNQDPIKETGSNYSTTYHGTDEFGVTASFSYFPGFRFETATSQQVNVRYFDTDNFEVDEYKFRFDAPSTYATTLNTELATSALLHPRLSISGNAGLHHIRFYRGTSQTSPTSDTHYINISGTSGFKTDLEIATEFAGLFGSVATLSQSFGVLQGASSQDVQVRIYSKSRAKDNVTSVSGTISPQAFEPFLDTNKVVVHVSTGSIGGTNSSNDGLYGPNNYTLKRAGDLGEWGTSIVNQSNASNISKYVNVSVQSPSAMTKERIAIETRTRINSLSSSVPGYQITASDSSGVVTITRLDEGTQGNHTMTHPGDSILTTDLVSSNSNFTGGTNEARYNNADLFGSNVIIRVDPGATAANVIASASAAITNTSNGFGSTITSTTTSTTVDLTQAATGSSGNKTITQSGFTSDGGTVLGFSGGVDGSSEQSPFLRKNTRILSSSHGHLPYVAPYLDPNTAPYAEIQFSPTSTKEYTIPEIIDGMSVTYHNMPAPDNATSNVNYKEAMVLSASISFDKSVLLYSDNYAHFGTSEKSKVVPNTNPDLYRWVIHPKWETPVLDFKDSKVSSLNLSNNQVSFVSGSPWKTRYQTSYYQFESQSAEPYLTASTGMWHQYGKNLSTTNDKGYFLTIVGSQKTGTSTGDLAEKVGFLDYVAPTNLAYGIPEANPIKSRKLGRIAETKTISEAVVAIPYYLTDDCEINFFPMQSGLYSAALEFNRTQKEAYVDALRHARSSREIENITKEYERFFETPGMETITAAAYQIRMMDKYILPPQFDFTRNLDLDAHVSYIFQFKAELNREDLSDIWQNMYPKRGKGISQTQHSKILLDDSETDVEYITHILSAGSVPFLKGRSSIYDSPGDFLDKEVRWLVFKAKYRSESSYANLIENSVSFYEEDVLEIANVRKVGDKTQSYLENKENEEREIFSSYSFNWPYDYFSMVELVKLESKVDFLSNARANVQAAQSQIVSSGQAQSPPETITSQPDSGDDDFRTGLVAAGALFTENIVTNQVIKDYSASMSDPRVIEIPVSSGFSLRSGSESLYLNGQLQSPGSDKDYTISGTTITLNYDALSDDIISVSYLRQE